MLRRIFWLFFGLGLGLLVGGFVVRRANEATQAVAPTRLADRAGRAAGAFVTSLREAVDEGRRAAATREAELRADHDIPGVAESLRRAR